MPMSEIVGAVFPTVSRKVSLRVLEPSLTVTVIVDVPDWPAAGVSVRVRDAPLPPKVIFAFGTSVGLDEEPDSVRLAAGVSRSPTVKPSGPNVAPVRMVWFGMSEIVGAALASGALPIGASLTRI